MADKGQMLTMPAEKFRINKASFVTAVGVRWRSKNPKQIHEMRITNAKQSRTVECAYKSNTAIF